MPTRPRTSRAGIIAAAAELVIERGSDGLTMQAIADRVGVRGPSLYKHFADRDAVLRGVELEVVREFEEVLARAAFSPDHETALREIAAAYRRFALEMPSKYALIFGLHSNDPETDDARRRALQPALQRLEAWFGDAAVAFVRARVLTAFLHGFVSMEAAGTFRLGGDVEEAFASGIKLLLRKPKKLR